MKLQHVLFSAAVSVALLAASGCVPNVTGAKCADDSNCPTGQVCVKAAATDEVGECGMGSGTGGGTGGGTTGGGTGGGTTGGGTGTTCSTISQASTTFFAGHASCGAISSNPNILSQCNSAIGSCSANDQAQLSTFSSCISAVPCTTGNETAAQNQFFSCASDTASLTQSCQTAIQTFFNAGTGGGGGTGGGTGGGAPPTGGGAPPTGGGGGCTVLNTFPQARKQASLAGTNMDVPDALIFASATDPSDMLEFQFYGSSTPASEMLNTTTWFNCNNCAVLSRGCTANGTGYSCTGGLYLARVGSMTVSSAPSTTSPTTAFAGSLTATTFVEWNLTTDMVAPNARCVQLPAMSFSILP